jgi:hypothetical protein
VWEYFREQNQKDIPELRKEDIPYKILANEKVGAVKKKKRAEFSTIESDQNDFF